MSCGEPDYPPIGVCPTPLSHSRSLAALSNAPCIHTPLSRGVLQPLRHLASQTNALIGRKHRTINFSKRNEQKDPENGIIKKQTLIHCSTSLVWCRLWRGVGRAGAVETLSLGSVSLWLFSRFFFLYGQLLSFCCFTTRCCRRSIPITLSLCSTPPHASPLWTSVYFLVLEHPNS